jgi:hypothetical protein
MLKFWMDFAFDSALLCAEAQEVMGLRLTKIASGGVHAEREARRMVAEKSIAFADAAASLAAGASMDKVVRHYRNIVRANKRRLTRS